MMTQEERRTYLITALLAEQPGYKNVEMPTGEQEQRRLLRSLLNVRLPAPIGDDFLKVQDAYLQEEIRRKGITDAAALIPEYEDLYLWQGDITTLRCGAIVNAANGRMTGCYAPCHACIDNCIHTFAGVQLRLECAALMRRQGHEEPTGTVKITRAYNLPCRYVLHTVGPIVAGPITKTACDQLASCYRSCLELADAHHIDSLAFCCISTGEFHFPNDRAADIAVRTVQAYKKQTQSRIKVIFNVFKEQDDTLYRALFQTMQKVKTGD